MDNTLQKPAEVFRKRQELEPAADLSFIVPMAALSRPLERSAGPLFAEFPGVELLFSGPLAEAERRVLRGLAEASASRLKFVRVPDDLGLTAQVLEGILRCRTEFFVVLEGADRHPIELVQEMICEMDYGAELVLATRVETERQGSFAMDLARTTAKQIARGTLRRRGLRMRDPFSGFFGGRTIYFKSHVEANPMVFEERGRHVLFDLLRCVSAGTKIQEVNYAAVDKKINDANFFPEQAWYFARSLFS